MGRAVAPVAAEVDRESPPSEPVPGYASEHNDGDKEKQERRQAAEADLSRRADPTGTTGGPDFGNAAELHVVF